MAAAAVPALEREVVRCPNCLLNQFLPQSECCRRCHVSLRPKVKELAQVVEMPKAKPTRVVNSPIRMDLAMLVLRLNAGLSQRQLALKLDVPRTYITKIERGKAQPTLASLFRFAKALDCPIDFVVDLACTQVSQ